MTSPMLRFLVCSKSATLKEKTVSCTRFFHVFPWFPMFCSMFSHVFPMFSHVFPSNFQLQFEVRRCTATGRSFGSFASCSSSRSAAVTGRHPRARRRRRATGSNGSTAHRVAVQGRAEKKKSGGLCPINWSTLKLTIKVTLP